MHIQQFTQKTLGVAKDIPNQLLTGLTVGQRLDALVMTPAQTAQVVSLKVTDSLLEIRSPVPLRQGQTVQLEVVQAGGKQVLKLIPPNQNTSTVSRSTAPMLFQPGQQVLVEVVKLLAENRLLLESKIKLDNSSKAVATQQFDVDVSKLDKTIKPGEKLLMEIVSVKPLTIQLKSEPNQREQQLLQRIRQLLPQLPTTLKLDGLLHALKNAQLSEPVRREAQNLLQNVMEKKAVNNPQALKQAIQLSGSFTEKQLLTQPETVHRDFKVNLLRLLTVLESELTRNIRTPIGLNTTSPLVMPELSAQPQALTLAQMLTKAVSADKSRTIPMELSVLQNLLKEVEGLHAKLQLNQLSMLDEPETTTAVTSWLLDLPLKDKVDVDFLQLQIDRHKRQSESEQGDVWSVQLRLDTQNLGPVQATVTMHADDVKIVFRAEWQQSAQLLEDYVTLLHEALSKLGISIEHISCVCGPISKPALVAKHNLTRTNSLVDISV